jgi:hypothetical protein
MMETFRAGLDPEIGAGMRSTVKPEMVATSSGTMMPVTYLDNYF